MREDDLIEVAELDSENLSSWAILHFRHQLKARCGFQFVARLVKTNELCGFICGQQVEDEAEIHKIGVAKPHRRKAVATRLLRHCLDLLKDHKASSCVLELRASNNPAKALYSSFAFQTVALRKKYYTSPSEDAIIMKLLPLA